MRKLTLTLVLAALGLLMVPLASPAATANHGPGSFPEKIALPAGFAPEGPRDRPRQDVLRRLGPDRGDLRG